jgi:translation initiation factor IF-3
MTPNRRFLIVAELRINDRIRSAQIRLVGPDGSQIGVLKLGDARRIAEELELDLVEVAPAAKPPVCRLMDYGKFKYEQSQKDREGRRKHTANILKEMKMRPKIDPHDYGTKKGHIIRFLEAGHKVKVTIMFRGREMAHTGRGADVLMRLAKDLDGLAKVDQMPNLEGRNMTMVVSPIVKKKLPTEADAETPAGADAVATDMSATAMEHDTNVPDIDRQEAMPDAEAQDA